MATVLIAYAGKTGTSQTCAQMLAEQMRGLEVTVADLKKEQPDPSDYDMVVVGGSVRFAKVAKETRDYLKKWETVLTEKAHGLFLCCGFGHEFDEYAEKAFSKEMRDTAAVVINFGGSLKQSKAGFWEKVFLYQVRSAIRESEIEDGEYTPTLPSILPENIARMATVLREAWGKRQTKTEK